MRPAPCTMRCIAPRRRHHRGRGGVAGAWRFQGPHHGLAAATSMAAISGIRTPPRPSGAAIWRSAGRPPSESASQRLSKGLPIPRGYPGTYPRQIRKNARGSRFPRRWPRSEPPRLHLRARHRRPAGDVVPSRASPRQLPQIGDSSASAPYPAPPTHHPRGHLSNKP